MPATLQLLPSSDWLTFLRRDYETMLIMFFGEPPGFDDILDGLRALELQIREM